MNDAKRNAGYTFLAGAVLLFYGWYQSAEGISENAFYNQTVDVFYWTLKFGGGALILVSGICFMGLRFGLILDAAASVICGVVMVFCGGYWISVDGVNLQYMLFVMFGLIFCRAAMTSLTLYGRSGGAAGFDGNVAGVSTEPASVGKSEAAVPAEAEAGPVHPASVHPASLPEEGETPPADGYLAALSKEDEEPPSASHK